MDGSNGITLLYNDKFLRPSRLYFLGFRRKLSVLNRQPIRFLLETVTFDDRELVWSTVMPVFNTCSHLPKMLIYSLSCILRTLSAGIFYLAQALFLLIFWLSMSYQIIPMVIVSLIDRIETKLNSFLAEDERTLTPSSRAKQNHLLNALQHNKMTLK